MKSALIVAFACLFLGSAALAGELPTAPPSEVGMSRLERLTQFFKADTDAKRLPGAVVMIARHGKVVYYEAFGVRDPATGAPMQKDSIFRIYQAPGQRLHYRLAFRGLVYQTISDRPEPEGIR